jgi:hypothetical protein
MVNLRSLFRILSIGLLMTCAACGTTGGGIFDSSLSNGSNKKLKMVPYRCSRAGCDKTAQVAEGTAAPNCSCGASMVH